jgi:two-component system OmpR family sensor kinase
VRGLSLRARLVVGMVALALVGLVAADVATYTSLRSFLVQRVDTTLESDHHSFETRGGPRGSGGFGRGGPRGGPSNEFAQWRSSDGTTITGTQAINSFGEDETPQPRLPDVISMDGAKTSEDGEDVVRFFTVGATEGGDRFRVRAAIEGNDPDTLLITALSLHDVDGTLDRLLMIELLVTAAVLLALAGGGFYVIRLGLRPLREIENTAGAITAGDLSRRVDHADDRTEVGRLGLALNAMLTQIETAFRAREASERKLRRFVADASHELRTPLAAVRAYAELFGRGADRRPDDLERAMAGITRESERMSLLVQDLLLLARLDEGRPLLHEPVRVDEVVGEAVDAARIVEPDRPIDLDAEEAVVVGDRDRLRQIVDNLLGNVRAHTPRAAAVHVNVGRDDGDAVIEVADSGPGLNATDAERVFERFYRADRSRARASGGVGLGLSIVAAVAEAHGGSVAAVAREGAGATFRIKIPVVSAADNSHRTPSDFSAVGASMVPTTTKGGDVADLPGYKTVGYGGFDLGAYTRGAGGTEARRGFHR